MKKIIAMVLTVILLLFSLSAFACVWPETKPLPDGSATESGFEMLDSIYNGAVAVALTEKDGVKRYVFIVGADARSMDIYDPVERKLKHLEFWETEELNFQMFYIYYNDMPTEVMTTD